MKLRWPVIALLLAAIALLTQYSRYCPGNVDFPFKFRLTMAVRSIRAFRRSSNRRLAATSQPKHRRMHTCTIG